MTMNQQVADFCQRYFTDRRGSNCKKWDLSQELFGAPDLLGMWIADMEFKVPEAVQKVLHERVDHGVFGYSYPCPEYYQAYIKWQQERAGVEIEPDWVRFSPGVVSSFYWLVQILTQPGQGVMIMTPVYPPFHGAVKDTSRKLVDYQLQLRHNRYEIDFDALEKQIVAEEVKLLIHCSPHNPTGRLWSLEELEQLLAICRRHHVYLISDEIHQDFVAAGNQFVSVLDDRLSTYRDIIVALNSPSKTFNLAGLLNSHVVIPDENLRQAYDRGVAPYQQASHSLMGLLATQAAYESGSQWLEGLNATVDYNDDYLRRTLLTAFPDLVIPERQATYVTFIDFGAYLPASQIKDFMIHEAGLAVNFGVTFGRQTATFVRLNCATHPDFVAEAADRIILALKKRLNQE